MGGAGAVRIRVLLCDDQALVRSGFRMILEAREDIEVVGEAQDGVQAVELAHRRRPDVILLACACRAWTVWRPRGGWWRAEAPRGS